MYGKVLGTSNVAAGISLLPATGDSRPLFIVAAGLIALGVAVFIAATFMARKTRRAEA